MRRFAVSVPDGTKNNWQLYVGKVAIGPSPDSRILSARNGCATIGGKIRAENPDQPTHQPDRRLRTERVERSFGGRCVDGVHLCGSEEIGVGAIPKTEDG